MSSSEVVSEELVS